VIEKESQFVVHGAHILAIVWQRNHTEGVLHNYWTERKDEKEIYKDTRLTVF
jgi:hypothetical protein